jgi:hypothetical protein
MEMYSNEGVRRFHLYMSSLGELALDNIFENNDLKDITANQIPPLIS